MKSRSQVFKNDVEAVRHYTENLRLNDEMAKTYKFLELAVAYGPSWRQEGFDPAKVVVFRMYAASGHHRHMAERAFEIFGERAEYVDSGLIGIKKQVGSKTIRYFSGKNHDNYTSNWGKELLSDNATKWKRLRLN